MHSWSCSDSQSARVHLCTTAGVHRGSGAARAAAPAGGAAQDGGTSSTRYSVCVDAARLPRTGLARRVSARAAVVSTYSTRPSSDSAHAPAHAATVSARGAPSKRGLRHQQQAKRRTQGLAEWTSSYLLRTSERERLGRDSPSPATFWCTALPLIHP